MKLIIEHYINTTQKLLSTPDGFYRFLVMEVRSPKDCMCVKLKPSEEQDRCPDGVLLSPCNTKGRKGVH